MVKAESLQDTDHKREFCLEVHDWARLLVRFHHNCHLRVHQKIASLFGYDVKAWLVSGRADSKLLSAVISGKLFISLKDI